MSVVTPTNPRGLKDIPFQIQAPAPEDKARASKIAAMLRKHHPDANCELEFSSPHELLVATILSAQTTDVQVNKATPGLFGAFPTPADYAAASPDEIEPFVKTLGFFRNKARSVFESMSVVAEKHGGEVPADMDALLALKGVARKTANVVLGNAFGINNGFVVDTHIQRFAWRFDLCEESEKDDPKKIERRLMALFPRARWCELSHQIIWHGRRACPARGTSAHEHPLCVRYGVRCPGSG